MIVFEITYTDNVSSVKLGQIPSQSVVEIEAKTFKHAIEIFTRNCPDAGFVLIGNKSTKDFRAYQISKGDFCWVF